MCRCSGQRSEASTLKFGSLSGPVIKKPAGVAPTNLGALGTRNTAPARDAFVTGKGHREGRRLAARLAVSTTIIMALSPASEDTRTPSVTRSALTGPFLAASEAVRRGQFVKSEVAPLGVPMRWDHDVA